MSIGNGPIEVETLEVLFHNCRAVAYKVFSAGAARGNLKAPPFSSEEMKQGDDKLMLK